MFPQASTTEQRSVKEELFNNLIIDVICLSTTLGESSEILIKKLEIDFGPDKSFALNSLTLILLNMSSVS